MFIEEIFNILPQSTILIFTSTFLGALVGEFYKESNNRKDCKFSVFMSKLLSSWIMAFATILFIHSTFNIQNSEILISISIAFGFFGYKYTTKFIKNLINSKFKSDD
jgi:hypothetical protein